MSMNDHSEKNNEVDAVTDMEVVTDWVPTVMKETVVVGETNAEELALSVVPMK